MFYLVFKPQRKVTEDRVRYNFKSQAFIGFCQDLKDAIRMCNDNQEANYQVYECEQPTLDFHRSQAVRYGFRRHHGMPVLYRRTPDGHTELIKNPLEDPDAEQKRLEEVKRKRLEGLDKRIQELQEIREQIA